MKTTSLRVLLAISATLVCVSSLAAARISPKESQEIGESWTRWWGTDIVRKFDDLPEAAMLDKERMPYAGSIYPDKNGGTENVLRKYDRAFHYRSSPNVSWERADIQATKERKERRGPFGIGRFQSRARTPDWAGHCNGWTATAIRHAEPENNVVRNGITFTPADIKGLMAELYTYCDIETLGGADATVNPATFHIVITNWLGRGKHPIAMDKSVGEEVWNYPIYGYTADSVKRNSREVEVKMNIGYIKYTNREYDEAPDMHRFLYFHYMLELDAAGNIIGGRYYGDSNQIDLVWAPLQPRQGGTTGNEGGSPHLNVNTILAMWRDATPVEKRERWYNIDPTEADRIILRDEDEAAPEDESADTEEPAETEEPADDENGDDEGAEESNDGPEARVGEIPSPVEEIGEDEGNGESSGSGAPRRRIFRRR